MKVLLAGATGRLGRAMLPLLLEKGVAVRALTRDAQRAALRIQDSVEMVVGDVRDPRSIAEAVRGVDAVVSAVTGFGLGGPGPAAVDYRGNLNLIEGAEAAKVRRFVLVSVYGAAPQHPMALMRMKFRAEERLRSSSLDWRIVRPTAFLELWQEIVGEPIKRTGATTVFGRGHNAINFVSVRDVAKVGVAALGDSVPSGSVLDVCGPRNVTLTELAHEIAVDLGRKVKVRRIPVPVLRASRTLLRPIRPDIAGMIDAGIVMDSADMRAHGAVRQLGEVSV